MGIAKTMHAISVFLLSACVLVTFACGRGERRDRDKDVTQNVTSDRRPQEKIFVEFDKTWRQFISKAPELALPVLQAEERPEEPRWQPHVVSECVFSADAGRLMPQATLTWNEPVDGGPDVPILKQQAIEATRPGGPPTAQQPPAPPPQAPGTPQTPEGRQPPQRRFDLSVQHDGFERNYFSTALATEKLQRFKLPANSAFVNDEQAVQQIGPGLFPKLVDFNIQPIQDRDTARRLEQHTLVLRDLSPGRTYTIRLDRRGPNAWSAEGQFSFLTPLCPR